MPVMVMPMMMLDASHARYKHPRHICYGSLPHHTAPVTSLTAW